MPLPSRHLLIATGLWCLLGLVAALIPTATPAWWAFAGLLLALGGLDLIRSLWAPPPQVARQVKATLPLGLPCQVEIRLAWPGVSSHPAWVIDHTPDGFDCQREPSAVQLTPEHITGYVYRMRPLRRGVHDFGPVSVRVLSPWRLWWKQSVIPTETRVKVFPNFAAYSRHALQATSSRASQTGQLKSRRRGEGADFEQLREYRQGDSTRQIDWKATVRMGKLISREFRDERDQRILLLADCGRRMGARDGELSHFDHALDSLLLLAWVGLHHGDAVGLMTLGGPQRMLTPHKSTATLSRILHAVFDLQPTLEATDFLMAAQTLLTHEKKRALVVILTNLRDEDDENLIEAAHLLARHHLVLVASLREKALDEACAPPANDPPSQALHSVAIDYRARREASLHRLRQRGVMCLDVAPEGLALATVNRYLAIKAEGRL